MFQRHGRYFGRPEGTPFQKGDLKYVILDLVRDKPCHGYEIIRILEERSHGFYAPSPGAVYPTLQLLEEAGYVTSTQQDGKKVYSITEAGRSFLDERQDLASGIKKHMKDFWGFKNVGEVQDTVAEVRRLGRLINRRRFRNLDRDRIRRVRDVVSRAVAEIEEILEP